MYSNIKIRVFDNDIDIINPFDKKLLFTQNHIFGLICVTVDNTYSVYKEVIENNDATKELNEIVAIFLKGCSTNVLSTSASKPQYNISRHKDCYDVEVLINVGPREYFTTKLDGLTYNIQCPFNIGSDHLLKTRVSKLGKD